MGLFCAILDRLSFEPPNEKLGVSLLQRGPKGTSDNKPPIYQALVTAVDRIGVDFDFLSDHSVKTFYSRLTPSPPAAALHFPVGMEVRLLFQLG